MLEMTASLNEIYKAIGSLETAVKGLAAKMDESDARADASNRRADEHRATVHRRVDELVSEVGVLNSKVAHVEGELSGVTADLADTKEVTDEVRAWKQRGIGALAIVGFGASGLTFLIQHYFEQIMAWLRG
jgi:outer membrane murein-binding lipoprotein Lpp